MLTLEKAQRNCKFLSFRPPTHGRKFPGTIPLFDFLLIVFSVLSRLLVRFRSSSPQGSFRIEARARTGLGEVCGHTVSVYGLAGGQERTPRWQRLTRVQETLINSNGRTLYVTGGGVLRYLCAPGWYNLPLPDRHFKELFPPSNCLTPRHYISLTTSNIYMYTQTRKTYGLVLLRPSIATNEL